MKAFTGIALLPWRAILMSVFWLHLCSIAAQTVAQEEDRIKDTLRVVALLEKAEEQWALYQWDSVGRNASQALVIVESLLSDPVLLVHDQSRNALIRLKAYSLGQLGRISRYGNEQELLNDALRLVRSIGDRRGEAKVMMYFSEIQYARNLYSEAIRSAQKAISIYRSIGDGLAAASCLNMSGEYYRVMGDPSTALECHLEALPIVKASGDPGALGWKCILIGAVHRATQDWPRALEYFYLARRQYERSTDSIGIAIAYNDLGTAYFGMGNMDSSLHWHTRAADLRQQIGSFDGLGHSLRYMALVHEKSGEPLEAIDLYKASITSYARVPFLTAMARSHGMIAQVRITLGELDSALVELTTALGLLVDMRERVEVPDLYFQLARVHELRGERMSAEKAYKDGLAVANALNDHGSLTKGYKDLFELYMALGDRPKAYRSHQMFMRSKDSVLVRSDRSRVLQLMMKHDLEQERLRARARDESQRSMQHLELEGQQRQKYVYIAGGSLFGLLAIGLVGRLRYTSRAQRRMKEQRRRLQKAKARAEQSEKFKERFLANMSHEIRTPMNAIMGMTTIMRRNEHLDAQKEYLKAMARSSDELLRILNDILDLSKLDAGRLDLETVPFDPVDMLFRVVDTRQVAAEAGGIQLVAECKDDVPRTVLGDPARTEQIIANLLENAIKFTEVGNVHVSLRVGPFAGDRAELIWSVRDTGPGIPAERMERIFEEFTKVYSAGHRKHGGTGLGLTISKRLVELQGGVLTVESTVGMGSTFTARIPYTIATDRVPAGTTSKELVDLRILLADDNAFNVMVAQDELKDAIPGVRVDVAMNGKEAVALARENEYDVVLMDVQMPELSGYDATKAIRALGGARSLVPILAMTANVMRSEVDRCLEAGMNGFLPKPFERRTLMTELAAVLQDDGA